MQLLDLLGAAQTPETHAAVKELLNLPSNDDLDSVERYLQALAASPRANKNIIEDLIDIHDSPKLKSKKIKWSLILTLGSMAHRYARLPKEGYESDVVKSVENLFRNALKECSEEWCFESYLNGLRNLESPETVDLLLDYINHKPRFVYLSSIKALAAMPHTVFNNNVTLTDKLEDIFEARFKRYDSSVRTITLDILLKLHLDNDRLKRLIRFLKDDEQPDEIRKYLLEQMLMYAAKDQLFHERIKQLMLTDPTVNNYDSIAVDGMSSALTRRFSVESPFNASIISVQESYKGMLKRGIIDLHVEAHKEKYTLFNVSI